MKHFTPALVLSLALLAACGDGGSGVGNSPLASEGQSGTTLTASKTAEGFYRVHNTYDWSLTKTAGASEITMGRGDNASVHYTLNAVRTLVATTTTYGASGQVCVTNGGAVATENLTILDVVQTKVGSGAYADYVSNPVDVSAAPVLAPGESHCYGYEVTFAPVANAIYRNAARVTITNHSGSLGTPTGPAANGGGVKADFSLPADPAVTETDADATVADALTCPAGFNCTPASGSWALTGSQTIEYDVNFNDASATCDWRFSAPNSATLTEGGGQTRTAGASVDIVTTACPTGCTLTIGYWKTHAGFTGRNPDRMTALLPQWLGTSGGLRSIQVTNATQGVGVLSMDIYGAPSNGITKLYAQMLAARLNIARGADGTAVSGVMTAANAFLAARGHTDWSGLSKAQKDQVLGWMSAFDAYNNGVTGPGHCN
ncbi:MAG TPA: hypothetical protein VFT45_09805 [Longimicrobium sp.]|nr:hypothetical protein [Longimicrobium sp.]